MEPDWSGLPGDLLLSISDRLSALIDHVRLRAVCRSWANTPPPSRLSSQTPWLLLPYEVNSGTRTFLSVSENEFYRFKSPEFRGRNCFSSSHGWLALVNDTPDVVLYNPLTCEKILLPRLTELPEVQRARENQQGDDPPHPFWDVDLMTNFYFHRIILSANPASGHRDCWAVLCYNKSQDRVAFCRLGDNSWAEIQDESSDEYVDHDYVDLIFHKGLLYALDSPDRLIICDLNSPQQFTEVRLEGLDDARSMRFTEMGGSLLLVRVFRMEDEDDEEEEDVTVRRGRRIDYLNRVNSFAVLELDTKKLNTVSDLGDFAMFTGAGCCISKPASETLGCRQNCIYFLQNFAVETDVYEENDHVWTTERKKGYALSSYDLEYGSIEPTASFVSHVNVPHDESMKGVWFTPDFVSSWKTSRSSGSAAAESGIWIPNAKGISSTTLNPQLDLHGRYSSLGPIETEKWSKVRQAYLPDKLLLVLWRVACGVVPDKFFVKNSPVGVFPDSCCPICHQAKESLEHLLLFCPYARVAWLNSPWPLSKLASPDIEISSWVNTILDAGPSFGLDGSEAMEFLLFAAVFIEQIWIVRNDAATGKQIPHTATFASRLRKIYRDHCTDRLHKKAQPLSGDRWVYPDTDEVKVNFDVAICRDFTMLAITYRDDDGRFLLAWTEKIPQCEAIVAEAKAAFLAISIAIKSGFTKLVVEGNAPFVIGPLQHSSTPPYHGIAGLIGDIVALLASLEIWSVESASVKENMAAHNLACWAAFYNRTGMIPVPSLPACVVYSDDMYPPPCPELA